MEPCTPGKHCYKCRTVKSKTKRKRPHNKDCKVVIRKLRPRTRIPVLEKDRATPNRSPTPVSEKGRRTPKKLPVPKQILKTEVVNPKKKYLKAGIFSPSTSCDRLRKDKRAISSCHELCGDDFLLPYNLWWEMKLLARDTSRNPSTQFKKVRSSITVDQPPVLDKDDRCSCIPTSGDACGEGCLNRVIFTECSPAWCPCGNLCTNRQFQRHQTSHQLERFDTESARGFGVRATAAIKSGSFLCEYVGEIVSAERFADRISNYYKSFPHHYALALDSGFVIDSYRCGDIARFVNHSCQPNCEMQKWNVNGRYRMGIFALRELFVCLFVKVYPNTWTRTRRSSPTTTASKPSKRASPASVAVTTAEAPSRPSPNATPRQPGPRLRRGSVSGLKTMDQDQRRQKTVSHSTNVWCTEEKADTTCAHIATKHSLAPPIWRSMYELTRERNHSFVMCVQRNSTVKMFWNDTNSFTQENSHFACKECGQSFNRLDNLKTHQHIHTGKKPYKCKWCDKRFNQSSTLVKHKRTHTGEKPYQCQMCSYRCNQSGGLRRHERKIHNM